MKKSAVLVACVVTSLMLSGLLAAAPAAWHVWRSISTGMAVCAQTSPGDGWERMQGAYRDAQCTRPGAPGR